MDTTPSQDTRIYIQLKPDEGSLDLLTDLQTRIEMNPTGVLIPQAELHLSLVHIGKVLSVADRLSALWSVDRERIVEALMRFADHVRSMRTPTGFSATPASWDLFGHLQDVLVLRVEPDQQLTSFQADCVEALQRCFGEVGIRHIEDRFVRYRDFQQALLFTPHVAMCRFATSRPELSSPEQLGFTLGPIVQTTRLA